MFTEFDNSQRVERCWITLFYGKIYYAVKRALLPEAADSVVARPTDPQMDYCKRYEKPVVILPKEQGWRYQSGCAEELYQRGPFMGVSVKRSAPELAVG